MFSLLGSGCSGEVALDEVPCLLCREHKEDVEAVDVPRVEPDRVPRLRLHIPESQELVGHLRGPRHLAGTRQPQEEQVQHEPVVLRDEGCELQPRTRPYEFVWLMSLYVSTTLFLAVMSVRQVVVADQPQQPAPPRQNPRMRTSDQRGAPWYTGGLTTAHTQQLEEQSRAARSEVG